MGWLVVWNIFDVSIQLGISSSQLIFIFFAGVGLSHQIATNQWVKEHCVKICEITIIDHLQKYLHNQWVDRKGKIISGNQPHCPMSYIGFSSSLSLSLQSIELT